MHSILTGSPPCVTQASKGLTRQPGIQLTRLDRDKASSALCDLTTARPTRHQAEVQFARNSRPPVPSSTADPHWASLAHCAFCLQRHTPSHCIHCMNTTSLASRGLFHPQAKPPGAAKLEPQRFPVLHTAKNAGSKQRAAQAPAQHASTSGGPCLQPLTHGLSHFTVQRAHHTWCET